MNKLIITLFAIMLTGSTLFAGTPPDAPTGLRIVNGFAGRSHELDTQTSQLCHQYQLDLIQGEVLALIYRSYAIASNSDVEKMSLWNEMYETLVEKMSALITSAIRTNISEINADLNVTERELLALVLDAEKQNAEELKIILKQILSSSKYKTVFFNDLQ